MRSLLRTLLLLGLLLSGSSLARAQDATPAASPAMSFGLTVVLNGVTAPWGFA